MIFVSVKEQVLLRGQFKNVIAKLESDRVHFVLYLSTTLATVAKCFATLQIGNLDLPFGSKVFKDVRRDRKLGAACVDYGWVGALRVRVLQRVTIVEKALTFEGPCSKPVRIVPKSLETGRSTNYLS